MAAEDYKNLSVDELLETAIVKDTAGKGAEARAIHQAVLDRDPKRKESLSYLAQEAVKERRYDDAIALIERYIAEEPDVVGHRHSLGLCYDSKGDFTSSAKVYREAIDVNPREALSYLFYGCAAFQTKEMARAASAFSAAFQLDPTLITTLQNPNFPPVIKERVQLGFNFLNQALTGLHQQAVLDTTKRFPGESLDRVMKGVWPGSTSQAVEFKDKAQRPTVFYMPELKPKSVYERGSFRWITELEAASADIQAEFDAAAQKAAYESALGPHLGAEVNLDNPEFWRAIYLYRNTKPQDENLQLFPKTAALLKELPLSQLGGQPVTAYFSILAPGARIPAHNGQVNSHVTVHLPLHVSDEARIKVGDKWHNWRSGRAFIFDDSFEHAVENNADTPRVLLVFEVWNPQLSLAERAAVEASFSRRKQWYENRAI